MKGKYKQAYRLSATMGFITLTILLCTIWCGASYLIGYLIFSDFEQGYINQNIVSTYIFCEKDNECTVMYKFSNGSVHFEKKKPPQLIK